MLLSEAIKKTECKYFGDYELSDDQREAVDTLVSHAQLSLSPPAQAEASTLPGEVVERPIAEHPCHGLFVSAGDRLTHRHWFQDNALMPTCERCGTPIDRSHSETGPVSWEPEKRREIVTLHDRYAISRAAMAALGEWLVWPDAGRDCPREVTVAQTLAFLKGLPNKLGYAAHPTTPAVESESAESERARIVAWLREQHATEGTKTSEYSWSADAIERLDHH